MSTNQGGASNSFFFVTEDKQFIVKTISKQEKDVMLKLLEYIPDQNYENSLICFPVGMFEVKIEEFVPIHLVVLPNLAKDVSGRCYKFDLKGSTYSRKVMKPKQKYDFKSTLKDLDLIQLLQKRPGMLNFQPRAAQKFL